MIVIENNTITYIRSIMLDGDLGINKAMIATSTNKSKYRVYARIFARKKQSSPISL